MIPFIDNFTCTVYNKNMEVNINNNLMLRLLNIQEFFTHQYLISYPNDRQKILELINIKKKQLSLQEFGVTQQLFPFTKIEEEGRSSGDVIGDSDSSSGGASSGGSASSGGGASSGANINKSSWINMIQQDSGEDDNNGGGGGGGTIRGLRGKNDKRFKSPVRR